MAETPRRRNEDALVVFELDAQLKALDFHEPLFLVLENLDVRFAMLGWLEGVELGGALRRGLVGAQMREVADDIAVRATVIRASVYARRANTQNGERTFLWAS